jgi:hypothetical protein
MTACRQREGRRKEEKAEEVGRGGEEEGRGAGRKRRVY